MRRSSFFFLASLIAGPLVLSAPREALAQCTVEGTIALTSMRGGSSPAAPITQAMRVTFRGRDATVEGTAPLAFHAVIPSQNARVFIGEGGFASGVLSASKGAEVLVTDTRGTNVIATIRAGGDLVARAVSVPCGALSATRATVQRAQAPAFAPSRRWTSDSVVNAPSSRCVTRGGVTSCPGLTLPYATVSGSLRCDGPAGSVRCSPTPHAGRCQPVGDGSVCGYHPARETLTLYRSPNAQSESVEVTATRDVTFIDDDGRPGWIRVVSHGETGDGVVVGGWVRARDVRWSQEVPPSVRNAGMGTIGVLGGHGRAIGTRAGFVTVEQHTPIVDSSAAVVARVASAQWCTSAEHLANATHVRVSLPGARGLSDDAQVAIAEVRWAQSCPP